MQGDDEILLLTDLVRKQYSSFLEQRILENVSAWSKNNAEQDAGRAADALKLVNKCVTLLEDKALKACMLATLYQRGMVDIIANVRRCTLESRLVNQLCELLCEKHRSPANEPTAGNDNKLKSHLKLCKATQTEEAPRPAYNNCSDDDDVSFSLQQKIQLFQSRLNKKTATSFQAAQESCTHAAGHEPKRRHYERQKRKRTSLQQSLREAMSPLLDPSSLSTSPVIAPVQVAPVDAGAVATKSDAVDEEDEIGRELAEIFCEETELDDIFGINPYKEPDDPQISSILKEIENAKVTTHNLPLQNSNAVSSVRCNQSKLHVTTAPTPSPHKQKPLVPHSTNTNIASINLRNSVWPCELFMQRRRLQSSLNRLIEEDFRWHELIKWKFSTLFGEDSDDEFSICSPTIELDDVLISSCICRISPWTVKHLMQPMKDGLIANRFLFKKLAKKLAYTIVMVNQYPDERIVKKAVEEFFCLHQAVMSIDDLHNMPSIEHLV